VQLGPFSFLLQKFEAKGFAANFMDAANGERLDGWWKRIEALDLAKPYAVKPPTAPPASLGGHCRTLSTRPACAGTSSRSRLRSRAGS